MVELKITGADNLKRALLDLEVQLETKYMPALMRDIGVALRDDARLAITTQGFGQWKELGKWQRAKTGRRKAFIQERDLIKYRIDAINTRVAAIIYYDQRGDWKLTDHATGFTLAPHGKYITVKIKDGTPLRLPKDVMSYSFRWVRPSVIPGRRVFADRIRAQSIIATIVQKWIAEMKARFK